MARRLQRSQVRSKRLLDENSELRRELKEAKESLEASKVEKKNLEKDLTTARAEARKVEKKTN